MCLHCIYLCLRKSVAAEEVGVVAEECHARCDLECPWAPGLGNPELGLERPAIVAEVEQLAVVVLPKWRRNLKAHANNKILLVAREFLRRQRWCSEQIDRDTKSGVTQASHLALLRLAVHKTLGIERRGRHDY